MNEISKNQAIAPTSTLTVPGLFPVPGTPTKLADLVNGAGVKLGSLIPASALTVFVHSGNNTGADFIIEKPGVPVAASPATKGPIVLLTPGGTITLVPQANAELSVPDLETHTIRAEHPGDAISIRYVRYLNDKD
ncbi:MAG: hypothetical protein WBE37_15395 [Bryobacteraceae bacterium]